jgi:putative addiction module component (TIGR02574 family)
MKTAMNYPSEFAALFKLPLAERLQLVEDLWDSIAADSEALPLAPEQMKELKARAARVDAGEETTHSWEEVVSDARQACAKSG